MGRNIHGAEHLGGGRCTALRLVPLPRLVVPLAPRRSVPHGSAGAGHGGGAGR